MSHLQLRTAGLISARSLSDGDNFFIAAFGKKRIERLEILLEVELRMSLQSELSRDI